MTIFLSRAGLFFPTGVEGTHFLGKLFVQQTSHKKKISLFGYTDEFGLQVVRPGV